MVSHAANVGDIASDARGAQSRGRRALQTLCGAGILGDVVAAHREAGAAALFGVRREVIGANHGAIARARAFTGRAELGFELSLRERGVVTDTLRISSCAGSTSRTAVAVTVTANYCQRRFAGCNQERKKASYASFPHHSTG
jgi:hypothetical protein